jgi:hypothetical protein
MKFLRLTILSCLILSVTACEKESIVDTPSEATEIHGKALGPFNKRAHAQKPGCPTSGTGCSTSKTPSSSLLSKWNLAVSGGTTGIKDFFTTGPWKDLFPTLGNQPDILKDLQSGLYEGIEITESGSSYAYLIGTSPVSESVFEYKVVFVD